MKARGCVGIFWAGVVPSGTGVQPVSPGGTGVQPVAPPGAPADFPGAGDDRVCAVELACLLRAARRLGVEPAADTRATTRRVIDRLIASPAVSMLRLSDRCSPTLSGLMFVLRTPRGDERRDVFSSGPSIADILHAMHIIHRAESDLHRAEREVPA